MLGAAAGVAKLLGVDEARTRIVLGIAASSSGGLQENIGTMTKPFHAGRSAEYAIVANDLAARGFTASPIALESPRGFFMAQGGGHEDARIRGKLGKPWSFVDRGIWLKPFPTGSLGHPALTKMLELVIEHDIKPEQVERIRVQTSENIRNTLRHHRPVTELEAKFSMEFCMAALLLERKCGLAQFNDEFVLRPEVQRIMPLVEYTTFTEAHARAQDYNIVTTFLEITLKDGRTISARADFGKGNKAYPMTMSDVAEKFRDCAGHAGWPKAKTASAIALVGKLETLASVRELTACLAA
jgi:2-methylcitrate dehydratase PrpD